MTRLLDQIIYLFYPNEDGSTPPNTNEQRAMFVVGIGGLVVLMIAAALLKAP